MIKATDPEGREYEFPDNWTPEKMWAAMQSVRVKEGGSSAPAPPTQNFVQRAMAERQQPAAFGGVGYGLAQGINAIPGIPGDIARLGGAGLEWLGSKVAPQTTQSAADWARQNIPLPPGSAQTMAQQSIMPLPSAPTTPAGKFAAGVSQYIPGGAIGGLPGAVSGLGSGLAAQGAQSLGLPPWAQVLAGTAGGLSPSAVGSLFRPQLGKQTAAAIEQVSPDARASGQQMMREAEKRGLTLTPGEALAPEVGMGPVGELQSRSMQNPKDAKQYAEFIQNRPSQVKSAIADQLAAFGPDIPPDKLVSGTAQMAQKAIDDSIAGRTKWTTDLYKKAELTNVPRDEINILLAEIDSALERQSSISPASSGLQKMRDALLEGGKPVTDIGRLNSLYKAIRDSMDYGPEVSGSLRTASGVVGPINQRLEQIMENASPDFAEAQSRYRSLSDQVNALQNGFVGKMAMAKTPQALRTTMFDPNNSAARVPEIADLFRSQGQLDLLRAWVRKNLSDSFSSIKESSPQGGANPEIGAAWARKIYDTPNQRNLLMSYAKEMDPSGSLGRSFDTTMKILQATGRIPGLGLTTPTVQEAGTGSRLAGKAAAAAGMALTGHPIGQASAGYIAAQEIGRMLSRRVDKATPDGIARMFTDPQNTSKFMSLARSDPRSPRALSLVLSMMGGRSEPETSSSPYPGVAH